MQESGCGTVILAVTGMGETLVIETKNFSDASELRGSGGNRVFTEKFTRTAVDNLQYEFTIEDTETWITP
ncbi:MAG: hypothetical protein QGF90_04240 [Gammaproteobacteria bacterium]|jgi:hypothetical protein|nr:hypothetical protein [Gammaproteobacteria bacterium]